MQKFKKKEKKITSKFYIGSLFHNRYVQVFNYTNQISIKKFTLVF